MSNEKVPEFKWVEAVKALIFAAGLASSVTQGQIQNAAQSLSQQYGQTTVREAEAEIARRLRNRG